MNTNNTESKYLDSKLRLKELMNILNLNQSQFAEKIEVKQSNVSEMLSGKRPIGKNIANKLTIAFGISKEWILTGAGPIFSPRQIGNSFHLETTPKGINLSRNTIYENRLEELMIQRIKEFIQCLGISNEEFSKITRIPEDSLKEILNRNTNAKVSILQSIAESFDTISLEWLITGKGSMLKSEESIPAINQEYKGAPYYNVDFIGGFDLVVNDQTTMPDYYINYEPYNKEGVMWCNVTGHSMEPEINHGDTIAIKELKDWQTYLPFGEVYGIVTTEHRTIKRVSKSDKEGFMRLIPTNKNPEFAAQDIPLTIVMKVFQVLGSVKRFS